MKKVLLPILAVAAALLTGCSGNDEGNLVVYGKIYQANVTPCAGPDQVSDIAEAMVIKDGKYIYVGTADSAKTYENENSQVIDYRGKGLIVPGMTETHGHYMMGQLMDFMQYVDMNDVQTYEQYIKTLDEYCEGVANGTNPDRPIYGFGFSYPAMKRNGLDDAHNIAADMDSIAHKHGLDDYLIFISDGDGHRCFANTNCIRKAGLLNEDGTMNESKIYVQGGKIFTFTKDGKTYPTGQFIEQANSLMRAKGMDFSKHLTEEVLQNSVQGSQDLLLANGYTNLLCAWTNFYDQTSIYDAVKKADDEGRLAVNIAQSYEIETWMDYNEEMKNAIKFKETKASKHVKPIFVKLFMDGVTESGTALLYANYNDDNGNPSDNCGIQIWQENQLADIIKLANDNDMPMHIHTYGDKANQLIAEAYAKYGRKEMRNSVAHARNITDEAYKIMAENQIGVSEAAILHMSAAQWVERKYGVLLPILPKYYREHAYPIKSLMQGGIIATVSTDYPATAGNSIQPFSVMETSVTGRSKRFGDWGAEFWTEECVTPEQMLQMLTINGAYQLFMEKERGSIEVGKYADFVFVDKDVLECPYNEIAEANIESVYFEGKEVFAK